MMDLMKAAEVCQVKVESCQKYLQKFGDFLTGQFDEYMKDKRVKEKNISSLGGNLTSTRNKIVSLERQMD